MKLKDVTKNIQGDFYIALPHKGVIKDQGVGGYCEIHTYNSEEVLGGRDSLPNAYLDKEVLIHPWDWQTLLIEVLE